MCFFSLEVLDPQPPLSRLWSSLNLPPCSHVPRTNKILDQALLPPFRSLCPGLSVYPFAASVSFRRENEVFIFRIQFLELRSSLPDLMRPFLPPLESISSILAVTEGPRLCLWETPLWYRPSFLLIIEAFSAFLILGEACCPVSFLFTRSLRRALPLLDLSPLPLSCEELSRIQSLSPDPSISHLVAPKPGRASRRDHSKESLYSCSPPLSRLRCANLPPFPRFNGLRIVFGKIFYRFRSAFSFSEEFPSLGDIPPIRMLEYSSR